MDAPQKPSPQEVARVQANVAKMRAGNATEDEVLAYLQHEDGQASAPSAPKPVTGRDVGRSFLQGLSFNFGDELGRAAGVGQGPGGLLDRDSEKAFKKDHPWVDLGGKVGGGIIAPAAAVAFGPEALAGAGGAAAIGAGAGMLSGVGDGETAKERITGGLFGTVLGGAGGLLGYGAQKVGGMIGGKILDRIRPERAVARAAKILIGDKTTDVAQRMWDINQLAPGGSSPASAYIRPSAAKPTPRFSGMVAGLSENPEAAAAAEDALSGQSEALKNGTKAVGEKMDALKGDVPMTGRLRTAMDKVREVLGGKTPELPPENEFMVTGPRSEIPVTTAQSPHPELRQAIDDFWARPGIAFDRKQGTVAQQMARKALERHGAENVVAPSLFGAPAKELPAEMAPETVNLQTLRDALTRLRYMGRQAGKRGVEANGLTTHDISEATQALEGVIYKHVPEFEPLDKQYGMLSNERRSVKTLFDVAQTAREGGATGDALGSTAGEAVRGVHSTSGVAAKMIDKLFTDKKAAADAVQRLIIKPGGPEMITDLIKRAPGAGAPKLSGAARAGIFTALPPALKGLLFQPDDTQP